MKIRASKPDDTFNILLPEWLGDGSSATEMYDLWLKIVAGVCTPQEKDNYVRMLMVNVKQRVYSKGWRITLDSLGVELTDAAQAILTSVWPKLLRMKLTHSMPRTFIACVDLSIRNELISIKRSAEKRARPEHLSDCDPPTEDNDDTSSKLRRIANTPGLVGCVTRFLLDSGRVPFAAEAQSVNFSEFARAICEARKVVYRERKASVC